MTSPQLSSSALDHMGRGYPRPRFRRKTWWSLNGELGVRARPRRHVAASVRGGMDGADRVPFSPETPASGIGNTGFYRACWYGRRIATAAAAPAASGCFCISAPSTITRRSGSAMRAPARTRAATRRSRSTSPTSSTAVDDARSSCQGRGRSARSREAARQAGLAARAALHLVSADDRHLADGVAGEGAGDAHRPRRLHAEPRALGDRHRERGCDGERRDDLRLGVRLRSRGDAAGRRHATRSSPAKCTAASRCPIRASTIRATSCSGARTRRI